MKYEFHVGDYVETKDGDIGIITKVDTDGLACWYCTYSKGFRTATHTYVILVGTDADMVRVYNRIGQHDFTKKDESKIEPLAEEYTKSFPICKKIIAENDSEWRSIDIGTVSKKINELVEAVNRLEEKVNNQA